MVVSGELSKPGSIILSVVQAKSCTFNLFFTRMHIMEFYKCYSLVATFICYVTFIIRSYVVNLL